MYIYTHVFVFSYTHILYIIYNYMILYVILWSVTCMSLYSLHQKKNSCSGWTHKKLIEENYELQMKLSGAGRNSNHCRDPPSTKNPPWLMAVDPPQNCCLKCQLRGYLVNLQDTYLVTHTHTNHLIPMAYRNIICVYMHLLCIQPIWFRPW